MGEATEQTLLRVMVHEAMRATTRPDRLHEWDEAARALTEHNVFRATLDPTVEVLAVLLNSDALQLELRDKTGHAAAHLRMPLAPLRRLISDYLLLISKIEGFEDGVGSPRLDTLDMAKRVYHDEAAEQVQRALAGKLD